MKISKISVRLRRKNVESSLNNRLTVIYPVVILIKSIKVRKTVGILQNRIHFVLEPLTRKNKIDPDEKKIATFDRQKQRLAELVDLGELREHIQSVRKHLNEVKGSAPSTPVKSSAAHERFAHLLVSPADLRQNVQNAENERVRRRFFSFSSSIETKISFGFLVEKSFIESRSFGDRIFTNDTVKTHCRC
jgi:hypothetical protein